MIAGWGKKALSWSAVALEGFSDWLPVAFQSTTKLPAESGTDGSFGFVWSGGFFQAVEKLNGGADDR
jgi:hypothetical protein